MNAKVSKVVDDNGTSHHWECGQYFGSHSAIYDKTIVDALDSVLHYAEPGTRVELFGYSDAEMQAVGVRPGEDFLIVDKPGLEVDPGDAIFHKSYDGEGISDIARDIHEMWNPDINPMMKDKDLNTDEHGLPQGKFVVTVTFQPDSTTKGESK